MNWFQKIEFWNLQAQKITGHLFLLGWSQATRMIFLSMERSSSWVYPTNVIFLFFFIWQAHQSEKYYEWPVRCHIALPPLLLVSSGSVKLFEICYQKDIVGGFCLHNNAFECLAGTWANLCIVKNCVVVGVSFSSIIW